MQRSIFQRKQKIIGHLTKPRSPIVESRSKRFFPLANTIWIKQICDISSLNDKEKRREKKQIFGVATTNEAEQFGHRIEKEKINMHKKMQKTCLDRPRVFFNHFSHQNYHRNSRLRHCRAVAQVKAEVEGKK